MKHNFFIKKIDTTTYPELSDWPWGLFYREENLIYAVRLLKDYKYAKVVFYREVLEFDLEMKKFDLEERKSLKWWRPDLRPVIKKLNQYCTSKYANAK